MVLGIAKDSPKNTKEAIIIILSNEWPLSAKKMYNKVRKMGLSVTYQAVFKTIKQLIDEGMLQKDEKEYKLNVKWLKKIDKESERILNQYEKMNVPTPKKALDEASSSMEFNNLMSFFDYMTDFFTEMSKFQDERGLVCHFRHMWWAMSMEGEKFERFKNLINSYKIGNLLCRKDTQADRMVFGYYSSFNSPTRCKFSVDCAKDCDLFVSGDYVVLVFFGDFIKKGLDKFYNMNFYKS